MKYYMDDRWFSFEKPVVKETFWGTKKTTGYYTIYCPLIVVVDQGQYFEFFTHTKLEYKPYGTYHGVLYRNDRIILPESTFSRPVGHDYDLSPTDAEHALASVKRILEEYTREEIVLRINSIFDKSRSDWKDWQSKKAESAESKADRELSALFHQ